MLELILVIGSLGVCKLYLELKETRDILLAVTEDDHQAYYEPSWRDEYYDGNLR